MAKSDRRKLLAKKRAEKKASQLKPGQRSRYALKRAQQAAGKYSPSSPFKPA